MPTGGDDSIRLHAGPSELLLSPSRGGGILAFAWHGEPVFRRAVPSRSPLDLASFPLVPFSNRIALGEFTWGGRRVVLPPNFPGGGHPHAIHGLGWQAAWELVERQSASATLRFRHAPGAWPWAFEAEQQLTVTPDGLRHALSVRNLSDEIMPAGLGLHPYVPRTPSTRLIARHRGEWDTAADGLPLRIDERAEPIDWWGGAPVGTRAVDTAYAGREGPIRVEWPERGFAVEIEPSPALDHTVIFTPAGADFFCVEPVTHATDALNRGARGIAALAPGDTLSVSVLFRLSRL